MPDIVANLNYEETVIELDYIEEQVFNLNVVEDEFLLVMAAEQGLPGRSSTQGITVSTENPYGGQDGDIWFKINV